jgi:hypothetical protein
MGGLFGDQFDYDHDGKLNAYERAEEYAYFEMLNESSGDDDGGSIRRVGNSSHTSHSNFTVHEPQSKVGMKVIGFILLAVGLESFIYFPIFAVIMIFLAIVFFVS